MADGEHGRSDLQSVVGQSATETSRPSVRVAITDARRLIAEALAALVARDARFRVCVPPAHDPVAVGALAPDIVIVGLGEEPRAGYEFVRAVGERLPRAEIVVLCERLEPDVVTFVLGEPIAGLLEACSSGRELADCLEQVSRGRMFLPAGWRLAIRASRASPVAALSDRQREVLELLGEGCSYEEIGARLYISLNTVKFHVRSIFIRLGVHNRIAAVRLLDPSARAYPTEAALLPALRVAQTTPKGDSLP